MSKRFIIGAIATIALSTAAVGSVDAGNANGQSFAPIHIDCGGDNTFDVIGRGNGSFAAAQVIGTTGVAVPLAFENVIFTYTAPDGSVFGPFNDPPIIKGSGKQQGVWCSYTFDIDTGNGFENFSGSGQVELKLTPGK